ncbi:hypothetical protein [Streptomyces sp. NPDC001275]
MPSSAFAAPAAPQAGATTAIAHEYHCDGNNNNNNNNDDDGSNNNNNNNNN